MAKFCGSDFLVKLGDGASSESFTTIAGMTSTSMTVNGETVDVTDKDGSGWRSILPECGTMSMTISLSGVFTDAQVLEDMITNITGRTVDNYQLTSGAGDQFQGAFKVASLERSGEYNGSEQYSISLESAGEITYTPAP